MTNRTRREDLFQDLVDAFKRHGFEVVRASTVDMTEGHTAWTVHTSDMRQDT